MAIKAIIGLGNPGREYDHTYHNIGAWSLPYLKGAAEAEDFSRLVFKRPDGFMNESGNRLAPWMKLANVAPAEILVAHDDSDLAIGAYKLVNGGGSAGHNGIQNIIDALGTEEFWRLRIGIRDPNEPVRKKALEFVLQRFPKTQEAIFEEVLKQAWEEIRKVVAP